MMEEDPRSQLANSVGLLILSRLITILGGPAVVALLGYGVSYLADIKSSIVDTTAKVNYEVVPRLADHEGRLVRLEHPSP